MDINMENDEPEDDDNILQKLWNIRYDRYKSWCLAESAHKKTEGELDRISESIEVIECSLGDDYIDFLSVEDQKLYRHSLIINKSIENDVSEDLVKSEIDVFMYSVRYQQADWIYQRYKEEKEIVQVRYSLQDSESMTQDLVENANEEPEVELELGYTCTSLECESSIGYPMETHRLLANELGKKLDILMDLNQMIMECTTSVNWTTIILEMKLVYKRWILLPTVIHYVIDRGKYYL